MRKLLVVLPLLCLMGAQCGGGGNCTVTKDASTGVATIICPDGTSVDLEPGQSGRDGVSGKDGTNGEKGETGASGTSCSVVKNGDAGATVISCEDGTVATVVDGADGAQGSQGPGGPQGDAGQNGTGCTVMRDVDAGMATIVCADGTVATVEDGVVGAQGPPGPQGDAGPAGEGTVVTVVPLAGESGNCVCRGGLRVQVGSATPAYLCNVDMGLRDGGDGACVPSGTCSVGYHDGGNGSCVGLAYCSPNSDLIGGRCVPMVFVAGGSAVGSDWGYLPGSAVTVAGFMLDKTEVTVSQYAACVAAGFCSAPRVGDFCNFQWAGREEHPVNCVDWFQAGAFCAWVGKRLPAEAEWQWAASNGGVTVYPWGDSYPDAILAHVSETGLGLFYGTVRVGTHPAGATLGGIQDLAGNISEWNSDSPWAGARGIRGGGFDQQNNLDPLKASFRAALTETARFETTGFRCAK